jgi:hypothetical protein
MNQNLDLTASAILIWLPKGDKPDVQQFDKGKIQPPPSPNPEPWWLLHEAIKYARTLDHSDGKLPWIKTGTQILSPDDIIRVYNDMGNLQNFGSNAAR